MILIWYLPTKERTRNAPLRHPGAGSLHIERALGERAGGEVRGRLHPCRLVPRDLHPTARTQRRPAVPAALAVRIVTRALGTRRGVHKAGLIQVSAYFNTKYPLLRKQHVTCRVISSHPIDLTRAYPNSTKPPPLFLLL